MSNPIIAENLLAASSGWIYTGKDDTAIQGYCDHPSYSVGDTITFYASTKIASTGYSIKVYRLGWYGGTGGRLLTTISGLVGVAQGYYDGSVLQSCPTAYIDSSTHLIEAGWASSATWAIPGGTTTGLYLAMFSDANGKQSACSFVIKGNTTADYVVIVPACTYQAYNEWGGYSLYTNPTVGVKVSFLRPIYHEGGGAGYVISYDLPCIRWLERQGYNISYITDLDVYVNSAQLLTYKAVLCSGHNEYWTKQYRDGVEAAIAAGVGVAFLGANASYWQCRIETDHTGVVPNATIVCYKVSTGGHNLANDPQYGIDNTLLTTNWRDAALGRPENTMIGIMYHSYTDGSNAAWTVDASADTSYFAGTGLVAGQSYGSDLVGYEWDKIQLGGPANLKTIGTSTITGGAVTPDTSNTTTYKAASGALVFASGSVAWTWALDPYRYTGSVPGNTTPILAMQVLFGNIMAALKGAIYKGFR
jgi:hypothetical protein